jgi:hypothetical protein
MSERRLSEHNIMAVFTDLEAAGRLCNHSRPTASREGRFHS